MNTGIFGEGFPYSNFHNLNMDWIIKIAKDFLDQYTHIQDVISSGETSLTNTTEAGLEALQAEKTRLEGLLDAWYTEHSEDIAGQLTQAISDFQTSASAIGAEVIASIPEDYTDLSNEVDELISAVSNTGKEIFSWKETVSGNTSMSFVAGSIIDNGNTNSSAEYAIRQTNATLFKARFGDYIICKNADYKIRVAYYSTNTISSSNLVKITPFVDKVELDPDYYFALCIANANMEGTINATTAKNSVYYDNAISLIHNSVHGSLVSLSNSTAWSEYSNDANNLTSNRIYQIVYNTGVSHLPVSSFTGTIITFDYDTDASSKGLVQLAFKTSGEIYKRMCWRSTWKDWVEIPNNIESVIGSSMVSLNDSSAWTQFENDMNNLGINKVYQIVYTTDDAVDPVDNTKNLPFSGFRGSVITFDYNPSSSSKTLVQIAYSRYGRTLRRMKWGWTWGSWYEYALKADIPNLCTAYKGLGDFIAIGDSWTVSLAYPEAGQPGIEVKSWATSFAEMCGSECVIYAGGGRTTKDFIDTGADGDYGHAVADTSEYAILYLGINDITAISAQSPTETIEQFSTYYAQIVNALLTNHKFVFCVNIPTEGHPSSTRGTVNEAIASICTSINGAFLVDVTEVGDKINQFSANGHLSSIGYASFAGMISEAISNTMQENEYFATGIDQ